MKPTPTPQPNLDNLVVRYHWQEGSVPPPYHYEYEIRVGPSYDGEVTFYPDYPGSGTPRWTEPFTISDEQRASLIKQIQEAQVLTRTWHPLSHRRIGGSLESIDVAAGDTRVSVPSQLEPEDAAIASALYEAVRALVPPGIWDSLTQRRDTYRDQNSR